jgi:hypothetical protein
MENLSFNTGIKEISVNNDETKIIRFNPCDPGMFKTIKTAVQSIQALSGEMEQMGTTIESPELDDVSKLEKGIEFLEQIDTQIRSIIDGIFPVPVCDIVFGTQNICSMSNGRPLWDNFLGAIAEMVSSEIKIQSALIEKNTAKYTEKYIEQAESLPQAENLPQ